MSSINIYINTKIYTKYIENGGTYIQNKTINSNGFLDKFFKRHSVYGVLMIRSIKLIDLCKKKEYIFLTEEELTDFVIREYGYRNEYNLKTITDRGG